MTSTASIDASAGRDFLPENLRMELLFWKEKWPYRGWPIEELQKLRHEDAAWFLSNLGFARKDTHSFAGFCGDVLEVGCGPMGFFELMQEVRVTAIDSLMGAYAAEIPYSTLGARGASSYVDKRLGEVADTYRFVVCSNVLLQTHDWMEFLEALVARVRRDGELLLVTNTRPRPMLAETQVFSPAQLRRALRWLGMKREIEFREEKIANACGEVRVLARLGF